MSLLDFLKIAAPSGGAPRARKLAIESLERRAVLTVLDPLLTDAVVETVVEPVEETTVTQETEPLTEPITEDQPPLEEPITEDPPLEEPVDGGGEEEVIAPQIIDPQHSRDGSWVTFAGLVQDDGLVEGLTVYFSTDSGQEFSTSVASDGSFNSMQVLIDLGTQVSIWTIDVDGNYSEYCLLIV
jgi:hypothetical protein